MSQNVRPIHNIFPGLFAPLTNAGNIVVDGVLASCYADFDHDLAHIVMTPMRWFPEVFEWIFGNDNGFQVFVKVAEVVGEFCHK